jgi:hypothetical protein
MTTVSYILNIYWLDVSDATDIPTHKLQTYKDVCVNVRRLQAYYFAVGDLSDVYKCELHRTHETVMC